MTCTVYGLDSLNRINYVTVCKVALSFCNNFLHKILYTNSDITKRYNIKYQKISGGWVKTQHFIMV